MLSNFKFIIKTHFIIEFLELMYNFKISLLLKFVDISHLAEEMYVP